MRKNGMLSLALLAALWLAPAVWAQGRGAGGQGGQSRGGQPQGAAQPQQQRDRDQQRLRIHATNQQRDQYRTCTQAADRVRTQTRQMAQAAKGGGYNNEDFRRQHAELREEVRLMQQNHERFMQGLSDAQRAELQSRIRSMNQARERLHTKLQAMDQELNQPTPDRQRLEKQSREMERAMKEWQKCYRQMGAELEMDVPQ